MSKKFLLIGLLVLFSGATCQSKDDNPSDQTETPVSEESESYVPTTSDTESTSSDTDEGETQTYPDPESFSEEPED